MNIEKLKNDLKDLQKEYDELYDEHFGNEYKLSYYNGWDLGHIEGRISMIEDVLDEMEE